MDRKLDFSGASVTGLNNNDTQIARGEVTLCFLLHGPFLLEVALCFANVTKAWRLFTATLSRKVIWQLMNVTDCLGVVKESWTGKAKQLFESEHSFTTFSMVLQLADNIDSVFHYHFWGLKDMQIPAFSNICCIDSL